MVFEGLTGCVREQGFHQQCIKNKSKIHPEIDVKSIGIRVRKRDAQNNGKASNIESKRQPKSSNMQQKHVRNSMSKNAEWKSTGTPVREPTGEAIPANAPGSLGLIYPHVVVTTERVYVLCVLPVCTCLSALTLCTCLSALSLCTSLFALHSVLTPH